MKHFKWITISVLSIVMLIPGISFSAPLNTFEGTLYKHALPGDSPHYDPVYSQHYSTIDLIGFTVYSPGSVEIDIMSWESTYAGVNTDLNGDGEIAYFDTYIHLFYDDGHLDASDLIDSNDDSDATNSKKDGSLVDDDSYLKGSLSTGNYILAIGAWDLTMEEILMGMNIAEKDIYNQKEYIPIWGGTLGGTDYFENDHGDYGVEFTGKIENVHLIQPSQPVPEPDTFALFGLGFICCIVLMRKKRS